MVVARNDVRGKRVSAIQPANAFDAAVRPVTVADLRLFDRALDGGNFMWRTDRAPLFRTDGRGDAVRRIGMTPWNDESPPTLDEYQWRFMRTFMVSSSRSKAFAFHFARRHGHDRVWKIDAPGGIDLAASLGRQAAVDQQEVVHPGGIRPEFLEGHWLLHPDGSDEFVPNPGYQPQDAAEPPAVPSAPVVPRGGASDRAVGVRGVSYPGPSRPDLLSERTPRTGPLPPVVHRGEFEIEDVDGRPHVRLYTVVSMAQFPQYDAKTGKPSAAWAGDVQQHPESGKITVLTSQVGRPLSVIAGRPLSAVQLLSAAEGVLDRSEPWRLGGNPPLIRSYLAPLDVVRELSLAAAAREDYPRQSEGRVVNVWPGAGPNLFTVPQEKLPDLVESLAPGSMVTYTSGLGQGTLPRGEWAGSVEHVDGLRDRLGVPRTDQELAPRWRPWPRQEELEGGSTWRARRVGRELRQHYATWLELVAPERTGAALALLDDDPVVGHHERTEALRKFLEEHGHGGDRLVDCADHGPQDSCELDRFMADVVRPWADQAAIVEVLAEDHGRMQADLGITGKGAENEYSTWQQEQPSRQAHQRAVGERITELWRGGAIPQQIVGQVDAAFEELSGQYDEPVGPADERTHRERVRGVLGQYLALAGNESDAQRVVPVDVVVKAILFRGLARENAERQHSAQYAQYREEHPDLERRDQDDYHAEQRQIQRVVEGAHRSGVAPGDVLALDLARRHAGIFAEGELATARELITSRAFDSYVPAPGGAERAFESLVATALRLTGRDADDLAFAAGLPDEVVRDVRRVYDELRQLHQAELSGRTSAALRWNPGGGSEPRNDGYFEIRDGRIARTPDGRHWQYSEDARDLFAELDELFESPQAVRQTYARVFHGR
ncbi:scabin-related ADP-ribosyltransferase [Saccharopolyspora sp. CA-218241]|uniref:scabin-related ADP-ribosyltransferase n=1 Tax=Saccharopolyspora sp. CA-218241 TaxID=3240027 RepID=UPI003D97CF5D